MGGFKNFLKDYGYDNQESEEKIDDTKEQENIENNVSNDDKVDNISDNSSDGGTEENNEPEKEEIDPIISHAAKLATGDSGGSVNNMTKDSIANDPILGRAIKY